MGYMIDYLAECKHTFTENDEGYTCYKCGMTNNKQILTVSEFNAHTIKRNHTQYSQVFYLKHLIKYLQYDENIHVSEDVIIMIKNNYNNVVPSNLELRRFLKSKHLATLYRHIPQILYRVAGIQLTLSAEAYEKIILRFKLLIIFCRQKGFKWSSVRHFLYLVLCEENQTEMLQYVHPINLSNTLARYKCIWDEFINDDYDEFD